MKSKGHLRSVQCCTLNFTCPIRCESVELLGNTDQLVAFITADENSNLIININSI